MKTEKEAQASQTAGWLKALSVAQPSPAAGSAAAITGAMGVALLIKLARLTPPQEIANHDRLLAQLLVARNRLAALAGADASAITTWIRTRRLSASDPVRQAALQTLVEVPLEAAELCQAIRREAQSLLEHGHRPALPDGQAGIQLLLAGQHTLCILIEANLHTLVDTVLIKAAKTRLEQLDG